MAERVLVVGSGFIGSQVVRSLTLEGVETAVLTRSWPADLHRELPTVGMIVADATDHRAVADALAGATHVVYSAGGLFPAQSNREPLVDIQLTLSPLLTVLQVLRLSPAIGLTFISSGGTVHGPTQEHLVEEGHPTDPITSYGILKLAAEKYIAMYFHLYGIRANILRCSNVYGVGQPSTRGQGVVAAFLHRVVSNEPLTIFGDGTIRRDFIHVSDVASVVSRLMGRLQGMPSGQCGFRGRDNDSRVARRD
jgi:UDP-glucose 4-epimerase